MEEVKNQEKELVNISAEEKPLTPEEEAAGEIHWKVKPNRVWLPEETPAEAGTAASAAVEADADKSAEDEEAFVRQTLEEARRRAESIPEDQLHPTYKKMVGKDQPEETEEEKEKKLKFVNCGDCGAPTPVELLVDNGSYLACPKCS